MTKIYPRDLSEKHFATIFYTLQELSYDEEKRIAETAKKRGTKPWPGEAKIMLDKYIHSLTTVDDALDFIQFHIDINNA